MLPVARAPSPPRSTNDDPSYALRNALRLQAIPALEDAVGRGVKEPMARSAALLAADDAELMRQMLLVWDDAFEETEGGADLRGGGIAGAAPAHRDPVGGPGDLPVRQLGEPIRRRCRPRPRGGPTRAAPGPVGRFEGAARPGVCSHRFPGSDRSHGRDRPVTVTHRTPAATLTLPVEAYEPDIEKVLISSEEIEAKLVEMGEAITRDYDGRSLLLVGVLKGAFVVMADLARHIRLPLEFDFMAVSSYGAATKSSGVVRILKDLDHDLEGRDVLLVEDIVDSGLTLKYLLKNLAARKPASLEVAAMLRKTGIQKVPLDLRYIGFDIPPEFVVGYGLDYAERFRNLPYVATLKPEAYGGA